MTDGLRRDAADIRWHAAGLHGTPPGLIPILTSLLGLYGAYKAIESRAAPPPPPPPLPPPFFPRQGVIVPSGPIIRAGVQIAAWALRIGKRYGLVIMNAVWDVYQQLRLKGISDRQAQHMAKAQHGVTDRGGGRRMNPANVKALRRAVRRVRSFQRITRKVDRLLPRGGGRAPHRGYRHYAGHRRRGDGDFYTEDRADAYDEAEDYGYEPGDLFAVETE